MATCNVNRDVFCTGLNIEIEDWTFDDENDELQTRADQSRRDSLVASLERSGIGSATHLKALSLEQLQDMNRLLESYEEKLDIPTHADDDSLEVLFKLFESDRFWRPFQIPGCSSCYDLNTTTTLTTTTGKCY